MWHCLPTPFSVPRSFPTEGEVSEAQANAVLATDAPVTTVESSPATSTTLASDGAIPVFTFHQTRERLCMIFDVPAVERDAVFLDFAVCGGQEA